MLCCHPLKGETSASSYSLKRQGLQSGEEKEGVPYGGRTWWGPVAVLSGTFRRLSSQSRLGRDFWRSPRMPSPQWGCHYGEALCAQSFPRRDFRWPPRTPSPQRGRHYGEALCAQSFPRRDFRRPPRTPPCSRPLKIDPAQARRPSPKADRFTSHFRRSNSRPVGSSPINYNSRIYVTACSPDGEPPNHTTTHG
jgi:hypothetical protein